MKLFVKTLFPFSLILLISLTLNAQPVSETQARSVAQKFMFERAGALHSLAFEDIVIDSTFLKKVNNTPLYYIFNLKAGGYVIVSASGNIIPVLAYAFDSPAGLNKMPDNFKAWMAYYERQIMYAIQNQIPASVNISAEWARLSNNSMADIRDMSKEKAVQPLLYSKWNQGQYYNGMCPADADGPGDRTYAGCVATAMGQLMFYHRWPKTGTGSYSYQHPVYGTIQADFQNTTYDWESMPNSISKPNKAIAELLFNCGVAVDMDYGPNGSGMWNHSAAKSLRNYFKYGPETEYIFRDSTTIDWDSLLIANLDNNKPLYYAGWTQNPQDSSGHAFVCDGYQSLGYYHFNWGWGGSYDGFFYLNALTPGGADFNFRQEVIKDIYPDTINYTYPLQCSGPDTLNEIMGSIEDGSGVLNYGNNASCAWLIAPELNVTNIKLTFDCIDTEPANDLIRVYNGETTAAPLLGTYSGTTVPATITVNGKKVLVTFTSNDSVTSDGFRATYTATIPVYCTAMTTLTGASDTISDGSSNYPYNYLTNCRWRITPPNAEVITIDFVSFDLDSGVDYLEIYDMTTSPTTLLDTYTGNSLPAFKSYNTGSLMVWFKANTFEPKSGWKLFYNSSASGVGSESEKSVMQIYPNPASDAFYLDFNTTGTEPFDVRVFSNDGRELFRTGNQIMISGNVHLTIPVNAWSNGLYVVRLATGKHILHRKLLINH